MRSDDEVGIMLFGETFADLRALDAEHEADTAKSIKWLAEGRCPNCHALLGKDVPAGTRLYCRRCKCERTVV